MTPARHLRPTTTRERVRRWGAVSTVVVLTGAIAGGSAAPASSVDIRTETTLGGFSVKTNAAPIKVLLDDPTLAIPRDTGTAVLEADPAYSQATLESGPAARALATTLWPGNLIGDGIGAASNGGIPAYPVKADARYPDKPYTTNGRICPPQSPQCGDDGGALMSASALGLDVEAKAQFAPPDQTGQVDVGLAASTSTATVKDGLAIGTADSRLTDVSLLGGTIQIRSVTSRLSVQSDGKRATSKGSTTVSGLTIGGYGYSVDESGAHLVGAPVPGSGPLPTGALDPAKGLGVTVSGLTSEHADGAETATRSVSGLVIKVDTVVLRSALNQLPSQVYDPVYAVIQQLPPEQQGNFYYLLGATPSITFVIGAGQGLASASLPLSFEFPDLPVDGGFPPVAGASGGSAGLPGVGGSVGGVAGGLAPGGVTSVPGPAVAPGTTSPPLVKAASTDPFKGIGPAQLLLVVLAAGVAAWGLLRLRTACFAGTAAAGPCTQGTSPSLPDLRGE